MDIPDSVNAAIDLYVDEHRRPGDFVMAVLSNDLREAVMFADPENLSALPDILWYCHGTIPAACWGSHEKVMAWLKQKPEEPEAIT